jgi:hypothetical protein
MAGSTVGRAAITRTLGDCLTVLARLHFSPTYREARVAPVSTDPTPGVVIPMPRRRAGRPMPTAASVPSAKVA